MLSRRSFVKAGLVAAAAAAFPLQGIQRALGVGPASALEPFVDALPVPPVKLPTAPGTPTEYQLDVRPLSHSYHRDLLATTLWGYDGVYPGPTFIATRGTPVSVRVSNSLGGAAHPFAPAFDATIPGNVDDGRIAVHLHGGETEPGSDGNPMDHFMPGMSHDYRYANSQHGTTLWYHDHALGNTRLNVMAGLAGFYLLIDPAEEAAIAARNPGRALPGLPYLLGLAIQDRDFFADGSVDYPTVPDPGSGHDHWVPEYFANTACVNGKATPFLDVEPRRYRFRVLNGSQARFYNLALSGGAPITVLGSDGGYLSAPVSLDSLLIAPGERYDVVIDFTGLASGTQIVMTNDAAAPFPMGSLWTDDRTDPFMNVMQFRVTLSLNGAIPNLPLPATLSPLPAAAVPAGTMVRSLFLNEVADPVTDSVERVLLNNTAMMEPATERPQVGVTEVWEIANTTADTHPIHLHLVQFRLLSRRSFNADPYLSLAEQIGYPPPVAPFLTNAPTMMGPAPRPQEAAWKDTVLMHPGEVTRVLVKFAPQDVAAVAGVNGFPFDPTADPGYVWHCHILEHEENDMMRPLAVGSGYAGVASRISIRTTHASMRRRKWVTLFGDLRPGAPGDVFTVEVLLPRARRWTTLTTVVARGTAPRVGTWSYSLRPRLRGTYRFRVRFDGDATRMPSHSRIITVRVR